MLVSSYLVWDMTMARRVTMGGGGSFPTPVVPQPPAAIVVAPGYELFEDLRWASYLYLGADHDFIDATNAGANRITNDAGWNIDTPEDPDSVLPFLTYFSWIGASPVPITDINYVRVTAKGSDLTMFGGYMDFWIVTTGTRWHLISPMTLTGTLQTWDLDLNGSWYRSWTTNNKTLAQTKASVESYGLSFLGWSQEPTGSLVVNEITWFDEYE